MPTISNNKLSTVTPASSGEVDMLSLISELQAELNRRIDELRVLISGDGDAVPGKYPEWEVMCREVGISVGDAPHLRSCARILEALDAGLELGGPVNYNTWLKENGFDDDAALVRKTKDRGVSFIDAVKAGRRYASADSLNMIASSTAAAWYLCMDEDPEAAAKFFERIREGCLAKKMLDIEGRRHAGAWQQLGVILEAWAAFMMWHP